MISMTEKFSELRHQAIRLFCSGKFASQLLALFQIDSYNCFIQIFLPQLYFEQGV